MIRDYLTLRVTKLLPGAAFAQPSQTLPQQVTLDNPATDVLTDFKKVVAVMVDPYVTMEEANQRMILRKVRSLLVAGGNNIVLGLMTANDVLGEKPMLFMQQRRVKKDEILVRDIMTPWEKLEVLNMEDVSAAKVGHIVATLQKSGRQHAIVVDVKETDSNERLLHPDLPKLTHTIRGVFSATQIARQLGVPIHTTEVAGTFAEIEAHFSR